MATVIERLIGEVKWDTNRKELAKARGDVDLLKAATKQLDTEQRKSSRTTADLREEMQDLRVALHKGLITKAEFKKRTVQARLAMNDEANAARRTATALRELRDAEREVTKAQREATKEAAKRAKIHEKTERMAAKSADKAEKAAAKAKANSRIGKLRARTGGGVLAVAGGNLLAEGVSGGARAVIGGIAGGLEAAFEKATKFESAMADVAKVVEGLKTPAGETTAAYAKLTDELKNMSTRIAVTPDGLAEMAAAAGQAGIKGGELTRFVEDAAKTMVAFDISSDEAGNGLAKLRANLGLGQDQVMSLAGTMNHLSNSMASTAAEVLDATLRVGAVGKAANVSGQEVAGYTSAMIAAGATSEIAATATKNMILSFAAGEAATKRQREAFSKLGLNAKDVAKQFTGSQEERLAVTRKVIEKLGGLSNDARAATSMQLFGRESLGPIASLTTNIESFDNAMKLANDSVAAGVSVENEYAVRSKTTANAVQLLKNQVSVIAIEIGEGMMPAIREVIAEMGEWLGAAKASGKGIGETLGDGIKRAWEALREFIGPASELPGKLTAIAETVASVASGIMTLIEAFVAVVDVLGGANTAILGMGIALIGLTGPWGIMAAAAIIAVSSISSALGTLLKDIPGIGDALVGVSSKLRNMAIDAAANESGDKRRLADDDAYERRQSAGMVGDSQAGRSYDKNASFAYVGRDDPSKKGNGPTAAALTQISPELARARKEARFRALDGKRKHLKPSEKKEYTALSNELDLAKTTGGGGGTKKHKAESAYEGDLEGEVTRLSKEAGKRAGVKAAMGKASRAEQYAAAKRAEEETAKQLRGRVDAGGSLPGNFHHDMLQSAGFNDVANRGTPPPIAVTIIDVKPMNFTVEFSGEVNADMRVIREGVQQVLREEIPKQLAAGIQAAKMPVIY